MCLAIPMKVVSICGSLAQVDQGGLRKEVRIDLMEDVAVGEYLLVHAGYAISRIDPEEARKTIELFRGMGL
jgi:hydrogenase expression/formation protein HypC